MDLGEAYASTTDDRITGRVVDYSYHEESEGHRTEMPIITLRVRDADRQLHTVEVEGFRPFFYITRSEFLEDPAGVLNDRRVIGVEGTFTPSLVADAIDTDAEELGDGRDIAARFSDSTSATAVHVPSQEMYSDLRDRSLVRVFCATPTQVGGGRSNEAIKDSFEETFEADIPFTRRFSITSGITDGISIPDTTGRVTIESFRGSSEPYGDLVQEAWGVDPPNVNPRMCIFDIEVATEGGGFPDASRAKQPITAICGYDSYTEEYRLWALESSEWGEDPSEIEATVRDQLSERIGLEAGSDVVDVTIFGGETALLESFHEWFLDHEFDMITGWNSDGFDVPYIIQRSYYRSVTQIYEWQSEGNPAVWKTERNGDETIGYKLQGRITLDMLDAYKKTQFRELPSYQLDDVAEAELGYGKIDLDVDSYDDAWHNHPIDFLVYNIRDVQAVVEIERGKGLMSLYNNIRSVTGADYETCNHNGPTLDTMFLIRASDQQLALPTNTEPEEGVYHGAKVFPTVPGYHPNAVYPDLSSLYPSLFAMLNLGVETIIGSKEDLEESEYTGDDVFRFPVDDRPFVTVPKGETYDHIDRDEYKGVKSEQGGLREMFDPEYQWKYALKPDIKESFIRETIDELIDLKYDYTGDKYSAVKRIVNSCFTPDTEVLTPDGVRNIRDIEVGDTVYSLNAETFDLEVKPVTEVIEKPEYDDEVINIETNKIDLNVTPDHRILAKRSRKTDEWETTPAGELNEYTNYELPHDWDMEHGDDLENVDVLSLLEEQDIDTSKYEVMVDASVHGHTFRDQCSADLTRDHNRSTYRMSVSDYKQLRENSPDLIDEALIRAEGRHKYTPIEIDGDDFIRLLGWYITEGHAKETTTSVEITISQYAGEQHEQIVDLIDRIGLDPLDYEQQITVTSEVLYDLMPRLCGDDSFTKTLPDLVWDLSERQKELLIETLMAGDGDQRDGSYRYTTSSDQLRDDVLRLLLEMGINPTYTHDSGSWRIYTSSGKNTLRMNRSSTTETAENGVYCIQVADNHTLVAGRNGKFQHVPNCYGVLGDSESGGVGSRLYNRQVAEGITLAGRLVIQHTAEEFTEYVQDHYDPEAELIGGDTDSSVTSIPNAPSLKDVKHWSDEAVEYVDASYDEFADETFWMDPDDDDHRLEVELESVASGLFFIEEDDTGDTEYRMQSNGMLESIDDIEGVQKRYAQHIVWDDDDGWIDTPDSPDEWPTPAWDELSEAEQDQYAGRYAYYEAEGYPGALEDIDDLSDLKYESGCTYDTYDGGPLSGRDPQGDIGIKGFEYVRSDTAIITKEAQLRILTDILLADDPRERIEPYIRELVDDVESGRRSLADCARPKGISQPLDQYGWKDIDELDDEDITPQVEDVGGDYVQKAGPTYRGAKYCDDHFQWEELGEGSKPMKIPIETVRSPDGTYPRAYTYESYPRNEGWPDPLEVGDTVDAIAVEDPGSVPEDVFQVDYDKIVTKELEEKLEGMFRTIGLDWDDLIADGQQTGLGAWG